MLNPKRPGCASADKDLAAVGVAFKLALAVTRALGGNENTVFGMLDLVALATIADIAPLRGENRVFVRYGLKMLAETKNVGLRALIRAAGLDGKALTAGRVGFILAPRLNAVGRLGHALRGVELLLATERARGELHRARAGGAERDAAGDRPRDARRGARRRVLADGPRRRRTGSCSPRRAGIPGVIGIVASRIVEEFGRPTVLIGLDGDEGKGSGRSISRFDLHAGIGRCRHLLKRFGGHRSAAGVTIARDQVDGVRRALQRVGARDAHAGRPRARAARRHRGRRSSDLTPEFEALLRHLEPCGMGNPAPVLVTRGVRLAAPPRIVGQGGLKLRLETDTGEALDAIGWSLGGAHRRDRRRARPLDIAYRLERDEYQGGLAAAGPARRLPALNRPSCASSRGGGRGGGSSRPPGARVRPTADRVREAWMSIVQPWLADARVLDLFAGSGALGLEALSRGAAHADFVESAARQPARASRENLAALGAGDRAIRVHRGDALRFAERLRAARLRRRLRRPAVRPRARRAGRRALARTSRSPTLLGVEHRAFEQMPEGGDRRRYGDTAITLYRSDGPADDAPPV